MKDRLLRSMPTRAYLELRWRAYKASHAERFSKLQDKRTIARTDTYSYKPFDDRRAIFVHIPKCAGVSVSRAIFGNLGGGHSTLEDYLHTFEPRSFLQYFKFTIVRNPWDRLVSAYFFLKSGGLNAEDRAWSDQELSAFSDFDGFVRNWVTPENIWKWHHFRPQSHYMLDKHEKIRLDFVGLLENLDEDFAYITKRIGIAASLPSANSSKHAKYLSYYTDETKEIVASVYGRDIELLGYNFDNSSLKQQLAERQRQMAGDWTMFSDAASLR